MRIKEFIRSLLANQHTPITTKREAPKKMATKKKSKAKITPYLETWDTRYGKSQRIVLRKGGKFVDNTSLSALKRGARVNSR